MQLCKNYVESMSCPLNEKCPSDHIDIRHLIRTEMDAQIKGNQWPLSCFGPFINKPSYPNYIEDQSFEEIRMMYYDSNTSFIQCAQKLSKAMKDAENKMETLLSMNVEVLEKLTNLYNCMESQKETKTTQSPFGKSNETKAAGTPVISPFGTTTTESQPGNNFVQPKVPEKVTNVVKSLFAPQLPQGQQQLLFGIPKPQGPKLGDFNVPLFQKQGEPGFGFFGIPNKRKELNIDGSGAPHGEKQEERSFGVFGIPKQQKELNFGFDSRGQKDEGLAQHPQQKTVGSLFDISKPHDKQNGFSFLATTKPLEQSKHRIAEPEKQQLLETKPSIFGVPKPNEQNKFSFGLLTSPEQQKQKNTENNFGFLAPQTTNESFGLVQPAPLAYPSLFDFPTLAQKQTQQINSVVGPNTEKPTRHSNNSAAPSTGQVDGRFYQDCITHFDTLLREANRRNNENIGNVEKTLSGINLPLLVIKPKARQTSEQTKTEVQSKIDPADLSIQIDSIIKSFEGSIVISCNNEESIKSLEAEVDKKCGANYDVELLNYTKDPQIVVIGIDNQVSHQKLVEIIRKQNKLNGKINFVKSFEKDTDASKYSAVIEVDKNLYKEIMKHNHPNFYIGWDKCFIQDNLNIKRCFSCWGFNHNAKRCPSSEKSVVGNYINY